MTVEGSNRAERRGQPTMCACRNPANPGTHSQDRCQGETAGQRHVRLRDSGIGPAGDPGDAVNDWGVIAPNGGTPNDPLTAIRTRNPNPVRDILIANGQRMALQCHCGDPSIRGVHSLHGTCHHEPPPMSYPNNPFIGYRPPGIQADGRDGPRLGNLDDDIVIAERPAPPPPPERRPFATALNRRAKEHMDEAFADLDTKSRGELLDLIADMRADWATLNEIHNARAQRSTWCTEYEERQSIHNQKLRVLKLLGRLEGDKGDQLEGRGL